MNMFEKSVDTKRAEKARKRLIRMEREGHLIIAAELRLTQRLDWEEILAHPMITRSFPSIESFARSVNR